MVKFKRVFAWLLTVVALVYMLALLLAALFVLAAPVIGLVAAGVLWWKTRKGAV